MGKNATRTAHKSVISCALLLSACSSAAIHAGPAFDAGSVAVSGIESGVGAQVEAIAYRGRGWSGTGLGPALAQVGYSASGDADPIALTTLEVRYRKGPSAERPSYWQVGTGVGGAWTPSPQRLVIPLHLEAGLQFSSRGVGVSVGVRERLLGMVGSGSPPFDFPQFNPGGSRPRIHALTVTFGV